MEVKKTYLLEYHILIRDKSLRNGDYYEIYQEDFRKGTAILLVCSMIAGVVAAMPGNVAGVKAASGR